MKFIYPSPFLPIPDNFLQSSPLPSGSHLRSEQNGALKNPLAECVYANEMYDRMKFISREHTATQQRQSNTTLPLISITLGTQTLTGYSFCLVSFCFFILKAGKAGRPRKDFFNISFWAIHRAKKLQVSMVLQLQSLFHYVHTFHFRYALVINECDI